MTLRLLYGALPVGLAILLSIPLSAPIVPDIHGRLRAVEKSLNAGTPPTGEKLDDIGQRLRTICHSAADLPRCEKWALEQTDKLQLDDSAERLAAVASALKALTSEILKGRIV
jgi:hypothetical protein